jgi:hypothetical protein
MVGPAEMIPFRTVAFVLLVFSVFLCAQSDSCGVITLNDPSKYPRGFLTGAKVPQTRDIACAEIASVNHLPSQCCCHIGNGVFRCLPHIIIAGAQKSGSTALFGYFLHHPEFGAPSRKEIHSFDKATRWKADPLLTLHNYLLSFPEKSSTSASIPAVGDVNWRLSVVFVRFSPRLPCGRSMVKPHLRTC